MGDLFVKAIKYGMIFLVAYIKVLRTITVLVTKGNISTADYGRSSK